MTPAQIKSIRKALKLSQNDLADRLRLSPQTGGRTVRAWESGKTAITGPATVALEFIANVHGIEY